MKYSALKVFIVIIVGIIIGNLISASPLLLIIIALSGIGLFKFTKGFSLYISLLSLTILNTHLHFPKDYKNLYYREALFKGIVLETFSLSRGFYKYTIKIEEISSQKVTEPPKVFLFTNDPSLKYGDLISFKGKILPLSYSQNPNLFDFEKYYHRRGIMGRINVKPGEISLLKRNQGDKIMGRLILPLRNYFFKTINRYLKGEEASLLSGLLLGEKREIQEPTKEAFARTGVMHILAVSGLHIGILVGILILLFSVLRLKLRLSLPILIVVLFLYSGITGFRPPVVRAGLMAFLASLGFSLERKVMPLNSVFVAGIIILLLSPMALLELSFQLSFAAAISILALSEKFYKLFQPSNLHTLVKKYLVLPFSVSVSAQIGVMPFLLYYFFRLPTLSIIANLIIVPLVGIALPLGFLLVIIAPISHLLASWVANTLSIVLTPILLSTKWLGARPFSAVTTGRPPMLLLIFIYGLISLLFIGKRWARKSLIYASLIGFNLFIWTGIFKPRILEVNFLDTYKSDVTVLRLPDRKTLLWQAGQKKDNILTQFLRSKGIEKIDFQLNSLKAGNSWTLQNKDLRFKVIAFSMLDGLSMLVEYEECSLLFIRDLRYYPRGIKAKILKLPSGTWKEFKEVVEEVEPNYIALPSITYELGEELTKRGIKLLCPKIQGGITLTTDGKTIRVKKMRD